VMMTMKKWQKERCTDQWDLGYRSYLYI
jgi:hypothetical protein